MLGMSMFLVINQLKNEVILSIIYLFQLIPEWEKYIIRGTIITKSSLLLNMACNTKLKQKRTSKYNQSIYNFIFNKTTLSHSIA